MNAQLEVCLDNLESLEYAQQGGATRIELCSALHLGGLTPTAGTMILARCHCTLPIHALIRPRQGDFLFDEYDVEAMLIDIFQAKQAQLDGVVIGALTLEGKVDRHILHSLIKEAGNMSITFHRAIDHSTALMTDLDTLIELGCHRVLTSGQAASAWKGRECLKKMVKHSGKHLSIIAGGGIKPDAIANLCRVTGVEEIHLSGQSQRISAAPNKTTAYMGQPNIDDKNIPITSSSCITQARNELNQVFLNTKVITL